MDSSLSKSINPDWKLLLESEGQFYREVTISKGKFPRLVRRLHLQLARIVNCVSHDFIMETLVITKDVILKYKRGLLWTFAGLGGGLLSYGLYLYINLNHNKG